MKRDPKPQDKFLKKEVMIINSLEKLERAFNEITICEIGRETLLLQLIANILIEILRELQSKD
jgi:hypothetical protein